MIKVGTLMGKVGYSYDWNKDGRHLGFVYVDVRGDKVAESVIYAPETVRHFAYPSKSDIFGKLGYETDQMQRVYRSSVFHAWKLS